MNKQTTHDPVLTPDEAQQLAPLLRLIAQAVVAQVEQRERPAVVQSPLPKQAA